MNKLVFLLIFTVFTTLLYSNQDMVNLEFMDELVLFLDASWNKAVMFIVHIVDMFLGQFF